MNHLQQNFSGTVSVLTDRWKGFASDEGFDRKYFHGKDRLYLKYFLDKIGGEKLISSDSINRIKDIFENEIRNKKPEEDTSFLVERILNEIEAEVSPDRKASLEVYKGWRRATLHKINQDERTEKMREIGLCAIVLIASVYCLYDSYKNSQGFRGLEQNMNFLMAIGKNLFKQ